MTDTALEQAALTKLLTEEQDDLAWRALKDGGWLDLVPDADGTWPTAGVARVVAGVIAASGRPLPAGAHLAAAQTLARARDGRRSADRLGVAVDLRPAGPGRLAGRCWSPRDADWLVVSDPESGLGVVAAGSCRIVSDPMPSFGYADVRRVSVPVDAVELLGDAGALGLHEAGVAFFLAAEALAAVRNATERTLAYLRQRRAFGQPLAAFQVLQHRVVDMSLVDMLGTALLERAVVAWDGDAGREQASWEAKVFAGSRGVWSAEQAIQLHGGIGFTWELGLHFALLRAQRARLLLGGPARAGGEVVARAQPGPRPGLTDWTLRPLPEEVPCST